MFFQYRIPRIIQVCFLRSFFMKIPEQVVPDISRQGYMTDARHDFLEQRYFLVFRLVP